MAFSGAWLDLREPADHAARDPALLAAATDYLGASGAGRDVLDLGCGTGSTVRAFAGVLAPHRWRLVDNDPELLRLASARCPGVDVVAGDLRRVESLPLAGMRLVTASALLDLVSLAWIECLADRLASEGTGLYAALSYDGTLGWSPMLDADAAVIAAFNRHQQGDKGFGPALGPAATPALAGSLRRRGFCVRTAASPWQLGPARAPLQVALVEGIAAAAAEAGLAAAAPWGQARRAASVSAVCSVGHWDLLALPPRPSTQSKTMSEANA